MSADRVAVRRERARHAAKAAQAAADERRRLRKRAAKVARELRVRELVERRRKRARA